VNSGHNTDFLSTNHYGRYGLTMAAGEQKHWLWFLFLPSCRRPINQSKQKVEQP
jgi:hypothetical protein